MKAQNWYNLPVWPDVEVETKRSAKPPCAGSIPAPASRTHETKNGSVRNVLEICGGKTRDLVEKIDGGAAPVYS